MYSKLSIFISILNFILIYVTRGELIEYYIVLTIEYPIRATHHFSL